MNLRASEEEALIDAIRTVAAEEILTRFRSLDPGSIDTKSRQDDLVTEADREAERRLTDYAHSILRDCIVVGEEAVSENPDIRNEIGNAETCVIIDPVDGTWNFARGLPAFGVIVSVARKGKTVWGMIYDPICDDWAVARRDEGAYMVRADGTQKPLRLSDAPPRSPQDIMGFAHSFLFTGDERARLFSELPQFHRVDAFRCSAHEYRLFAQQNGEFMLSSVLNPWDHAAGCLIAEEAGGVARLLDGTRYAPSLHTGRLLVARSEDVWDQMAAIFQAARLEP